MELVFVVLLLSSAFTVISGAQYMNLRPPSVPLVVNDPYFSSELTWRLVCQLTLAEGHYIASLLLSLALLYHASSVHLLPCTPLHPVNWLIVYPHPQPLTHSNTCVYALFAVYSLVELRSTDRWVANILEQSDEHGAAGCMKECVVWRKADRCIYIWSHIFIYFHLSSFFLSVSSLLFPDYFLIHTAPLSLIHPAATMLTRPIYPLQGHRPRGRSSLSYSWRKFHRQRADTSNATARPPACPTYLHRV